MFFCRGDDMAVCFRSECGGYARISAKAQGEGEVLEVISSEKGWLSNRGALPDQQQLAEGTGTGLGISCCDTEFYPLVSSSKFAPTGRAHQFCLLFPVPSLLQILALQPLGTDVSDLCRKTTVAVQKKKPQLYHQH